MSIATELQNYNDGLLAIYNKISAKGGTVPANKNLDNVPNAIDSIPVGGGGDEPSGDATITSYTRATGKIAGSGFGSTAGTVYMLDRDTHTYIAQPTSAWSSTEITLTTPLDLEHLEGNTSIVVVKSDGTWSTKLLVYGDVAVSGWAKLYIKDGSTGVMRTVTATSSTELLSLKQSAGVVFAGAFTINGDTFYADELVGIQIGSSYNLTSITTQNFLCDFTNLNQPVVIPDATTTGPQYFMNYCTNFNQPIKVNFSAIPANFMNFCYTFDQPFEFPANCVSTGQRFLGACTSFNQPLTFPSGFKIFGNYFLVEGNNIGTKFNRPLTIPSGVTSIGTNFLGHNTNFNQPLTIPSTVTEIKDSFLSGCSSFNSVITLPNTLTKIGSYFLSNCPAYNQPLTIPSTVTQIGANFIGAASGPIGSSCAFNQPLTLPSNLTKIGNYFLSYAVAFSKKIVIPSTVTSLGTYFLYNAMGVTELEVNTTTSPTGNYSLAASSTGAKMYSKGITITGTGASTWITNLPDRTSTPYRKLIDGTA